MKNVMMNVAVNGENTDTNDRLCYVPMNPKPKSLCFTSKSRLVKIRGRNNLSERGGSNVKESLDLRSNCHNGDGK